MISFLPFARFLNPETKIWSQNQVIRIKKYYCIDQTFNIEDEIWQSVLNQHMNAL